MKFTSSITILLIFLIPIILGAQTTAEGDFYSVDKIREVRIKFKQENWSNYLDSLRSYGDGLLLADVSIDNRMFRNSGIRYRGTKSYIKGGQRNPLFIKLNYINKKQNHQGFYSIKFSSSLRDPSMVREVLAYEMAGKYMHAPRANFAKIFVNDKFYGLFVNVEDISFEFLDSHFGTHQNSFFKCTPIPSATPGGAHCKNRAFASLDYESSVDCYLPNYELKSESGWDDLIELTRILAEEPENLSSVLNIDQSLWMLAFNNLIVNLSSYTGQVSENYYLYKDDNGRFNPIIWDLNLAFGSFKNTGRGSDLNLKELQELDPLLHMDNPAKPLIKALLSNPEYQKVYLSHLRVMLFDYFVNGQYAKRAEELQNLISGDWNSDPNKFYGPLDFVSSLNTTVGKKSKIPGIVELMSKRSRFLKKHRELSGVPPQVTKVEVVGRASYSNQLVDKFNILATVIKRAKKVKIYYRFQPGQEYQMTLMSDDGKNQDGAPGDKVFGVTIDPQGLSDSIEYYIVAENPLSVNYYPSSYVYAPLRSNFSELNK